MIRRTFLHSLGATLALPTVARAARFTTAAPRAKLDRIGIQLYTLREAAAKDLTQALTDIASIGYAEVELLDSMKNFGMPPKQLRALLDRLHLRAPSTHVSGEAFDDLQRRIDDAHVLGHQYLVLASLPTEKPTLDDYRAWADRLNKAGEIARKSGVWIAFHDEAQDFKAIAGTVPYDLFVSRLDPKLVRLQLDTGNAGVGGADPLAYFEKYRERYFLFHIKDVQKFGAEHDTELGTGVIDFGRLLSRLEHVEQKHVYIEQESYAGMPIESARKDYAYLRALAGK